MQTPKEALLAIYRGEMPEYIPADTHIREIAFPGDRFILPGDLFEPYGTGPDAWGVMWTNLGPSPGLDGSMVAANFTLFEDVEDWKHYVKFPDPEAMHFGEILKGTMQAMGVNPETEVVSALLLSGQFERLNEMIGMENALCAFYECPDELHEFFEAMCEYKLKCIELAHKAIHPDVIQMHDDWGAANNMLFSPELWREFIKPNEARYAQKIHELGMLYEHHSCGYIQQIIPDLCEIGVDCLNPVNVCNDVAAIKAQCGGKITIKGGVDNQKIDSGHATEEEIRAEVRRCIDAYAKGGRYIPSYIPTNAQVLGIFSDEVEKYGANIYK